MRLNLGSGFRPREDYINIDCRSDCKPDLLHDVIDGLPYDDNSVEEIIAYDFLEHIPIGKTIYVIEEIWRVLVPGGRFEHFTPSTDGRGAFQDPTHRSFWNINSWLYYIVDSYRQLIGTKAKFKGHLTDIITDNQGQIIHTHGVLEAIK